MPLEKRFLQTTDTTTQPTITSLPADTQRVLVIMIDYHLGDFTISLPIIEALAAYFDQGIDLAVFHHHASLVQMLPSADKIQILPYITEKKKRDWRQTVNFVTLALRLRWQRYQAVFTLSSRSPCALLAWATRCRHRFGTHSARRSWVYTEILAKDPIVHRIDLMAPLLQRIGIRGRPPICQLILPTAAQERAQSCRREHLGETHDYAVIHPTAGKACRQWPGDRFAQVADTLITRHGLPVCLVGTANERPILEQIQGQIQQADQAIILTESLPVTLALLQHCRLFVCNFSGPTHLAGLSTQAPIVCLSGPTDTTYWGLLGPSPVTMLSGPVCKTRCKKDNCTIGMVCIRDVSVDDVRNAVAHQLSKH